MRLIDSQDAANFCRFHLIKNKLIRFEWMISDANFRLNKNKQTALIIFTILISCGSLVLVLLHPPSYKLIAKPRKLN